MLRVKVSLVLKPGEPLNAAGPSWTKLNRHAGIPPRVADLPSNSFPFPATNVLNSWPIRAACPLLVSQILEPPDIGELKFNHMSRF